MRQEDHFKAYEQHRATIFKWGVDVQGLDNSQRIVGLHTSRGIIELLSFYLHKNGLIERGQQLNHRWFKSERNISEKLPRFDGFSDLIPRMVRLELLSETLSYGTQRPLDATEKALELFSEIENTLLEMIGDE